MKWAIIYFDGQKLVQEFSNQKKCKLWNPISIFRSFHFLKQTKTPTISQVFLSIFFFISVHHYLLATMHFMCKQRRATTIFLISIDAQLHGLRTPNEAFFHQNPKLLGLGRQIGQINVVAFGVFSADCESLVHVFH